MKRRARTSHPKRKAPAAPAQERILDIAGIGARGDAIAVAAEGDAPVFVPFALPGERVRSRVANGRGAVLALEVASSDRIAPACDRFTRCGGCQLQHWAPTPYLDWKRAEIVRALSRRGLSAPVAPTMTAWGAGRRRATLHAMRDGADLRVGFMERGAARIEALDDCPALAPQLSQMLPGLTELARLFAPGRGTLAIQLLATEAGVDVTLEGADNSFDLTRLEATADLAQRLDLARLTVNGEPMVTRRTPVLTMGRARVTPPPGAFLQATEQGERILAGLALEGLAGARQVADLYCGLGTFALRIAEFAEVHAVEGEAAALTALKAAADATAGALRPVTTERRDLARDPLTAKELAGFDAVLFDPPRAGAAEQAERIADSDIGRVVAVSCDPGTFARDMRILTDAGFAMIQVTPVDQFRWTPHVETVAVLRRSAA